MSAKPVVLRRQSQCDIDDTINTCRTMLIGYARVSTRDQKNPALQLDALRQAGCGKIFEEQRSDAQRDRPALARALDYAREGDVLVVWKLDRLARSLRRLIEMVGGIEETGVGFRSLTEAIDTPPSGVSPVRLPVGVRARTGARTNEGGTGSSPGPGPKPGAAAQARPEGHRRRQVDAREPRARVRGCLPSPRRDALDALPSSARRRR